MLKKVRRHSEREPSAYKCEPLAKAVNAEVIVVGHLKHLDSDSQAKFVLLPGFGSNTCTKTRIWSLSEVRAWTVTKDLDRRSSTSYITLCNCIVSHGLPIVDIRVFAKHTNGSKRKQTYP